MNSMARHMRISNVAVSDEDVDSRQSAATSLATKWGKVKNVSAIVAKVEEVAEALGGDGSPSQTLGEEVEAVIQKTSSSYLFEERPLDIGICAGVAMISMFDRKRNSGGKWLITDVYAVALWSALGYQPALKDERRESLRREVISAASNWAKSAAEKERLRIDVPDPATVEITIGEDEKAKNNVNEAMMSTVDALRYNATLDREELDFLWWAQLGRSRLLDRQLLEIKEPTRIVAEGVEGAKLLRHLPCEVHREIVLRTLDQDPELDLTELLAAIGSDRATLGKPFLEGNVAEYSFVFPLLHALATGEARGAGATVKRRVSEWGERTLLEACFVRMLSDGAGKL
ncbi:GTPase-associated system all-helical protein GASH [Saccharospirillum impatiens]|uniref:GTPase-associated system all-helical protein GASH n=1 Tax=Saccharospirillum impatiens TaxID=169438 RepID=UPI0004053761|nr:GTPase-associated system all-helical protein GASH [Saccharospirillum impatiens]